ncbi:MAG: hypothetical protein ACLPLZ_13215 [Terracidiphilus sp.]
MKVTRTFVALVLAAAVATPLTGCGPRAPRVSGKTYATSAGDLIKFFDNGEAREMNGVFGVMYGGQQIDFDSNGLPTPIECKYNQNADKVTLTCDGVAGAVFTLNKDGSLSGPADGLWHHAEFSHMTESKQ